MIYLTLGLFYILTKIKFQCGNSLKTNCKLSMNEKLQCWTCCIRVYGNNIISRNIVLEKTKPITWFCSPEGWEVASVCVCVGDKREDEDWCWRVIAALTQSPSNRKHQLPWGPMRARGEQCVLSLVAVNGIFQEAGEQWASHPGGAGAVCLSACPSACLSVCTHRGRLRLQAELERLWVGARTVDVAPRSRGEQKEELSLGFTGLLLDGII